MDDILFQVYEDYFIYKMQKFLVFLIWWRCYMTYDRNIAYIDTIIYIYDI